MFVENEDTWVGNADTRRLNGFMQMGIKPAWAVWHVRRIINPKFQINPPGRCGMFVE